MSDVTLSEDATKGSLLLIVDDVPANLSVLGVLLHGAGFKVKAANSGRAALHYAAQEPHPALILLDVMMPEMNGYEVLRQLRQDPAHPRHPGDLPHCPGQRSGRRAGLSARCRGLYRQADQARRGAGPGEEPVAGEAGTRLAP